MKKNDSLKPCLPRRQQCTCFAGSSREHSTYCPREGMDYDVESSLAAQASVHEPLEFCPLWFCSHSGVTIWRSDDIVDDHYVWVIECDACGLNVSHTVKSYLLKLWNTRATQEVRASVQDELKHGITREEAFELASEAELPILEILMRGGPIATNRFRLQAAREIIARAQEVPQPQLKELGEEAARQFFTKGQCSIDDSVESVGSDRFGGAMQAGLDRDRKALAAIISEVFATHFPQASQVWDKAINIVAPWADAYKSCREHFDDPCCHVRLATTIVEALEAAKHEETK